MGGGGERAASDTGPLRRPTVKGVTCEGVLGGHVSTIEQTRGGTSHIVGLPIAAISKKISDTSPIRIPMWAFCNRRQVARVRLREM